jgi:uncharacterized protein (DUF3820 family)
MTAGECVSFSARPGPVMPFGKHKGTPLAELPSEYLVWLGCLDDLRQPFLKHVLHEMGRRLAMIEAQT